MSAAGRGAPQLLAADVGGTKTALALAERGPSLRILAQAVYPSQSYARLEDVVSEFLRDHGGAPRAGTIGAACFAVAGPVADNGARLTNLGWTVTGQGITDAFGIPHVRFVNDFAAAGRGIEHLGPDDLETLQEGEPAEHGARLIVGPGTGLGMSVMTWEQGRWAVHASEAGHVDFAPIDDVQDGLLEHLRRAFGRVSCERVISGPGLMRIFSYLQESGAGLPSKAFLDAVRSRTDTASVITEFALERRDPLAVRALDLFVAAYGSFAGNMALVVLARGGVFLSGGISPKILPALRDGGFIRAFNSKGRFSDLLATIPVRVVTNPQVGLYGAVLEANRLGG